jgi:hypothetical protein
MPAQDQGFELSPTFRNAVEEGKASARQEIEQAEKSAASVTRVANYLTDVLKAVAKDQPDLGLTVMQRVKEDHIFIELSTGVPTARHAGIEGLRIYENHYQVDVAITGKESGEPKPKDMQTFEGAFPGTSERGGPSEEDIAIIIRKVIEKATVDKQIAGYKKAGGSEYRPRP